MPAAQRNTVKNRLLTALPHGELEQFYSNLHPVSLSLRQVVHAAGAPIEDVYFVEEGLGSVLTNMADGSTIEVGMIGMEGVIGISALLGAEVSAQMALVQIPGTALRMSTTRCKADIRSKRCLSRHRAALRRGDVEPERSNCRL
jgi:CRP-like cAMP-binding protein